MGVNQAQATLAYNFTGVTGNQGASDYSLGTVFTVGATPIQVNALGAFDDPGNGAGLAQPIQVAIYETTFGVLTMPVVTIDNSDPLINNTRLETLSSPVTLTSGTYMIVANHYGGLYEQNWNVANGGTAATANTGGGLVSYGQNFYNNNANLTWGTFLPGGFTLDASGATPAYAAGNFDFTPVPEASHFALAGIGLLGLVYTGRSLWLRRRVTA